MPFSCLHTRPLSPAAPRWPTHPTGATAQAASGAVSATARLMDYVTVSPAWQTEADAAGGPLAPGLYGIVLMDDRSDDKPLKVCAGRGASSRWLGGGSLPPLSPQSSGLV